MALNETSEAGSRNDQPQKLSHKQWKKLKRKQKRKMLAKQRTENAAGDNTDTDTDEERRRRRATEEENIRQHRTWEGKDRLAHQQWLKQREHQERERQKQEETERKIREEWEEREKKEQEEREKKETEEAERKEKQDILLKQATKNENKEWHNPLAPVNYNRNSGAEIVREVNKCPFFTKTGACRFGDRCSRAHLRPESSTILLIAGMFHSFELKKSSVDDYDTDMNLEYEDSELYSAFREFYDDVVPEFKSVGRLVNIKVCCNHEQHLRGNVYVQYKRESEAYDAFVKFNARWYGGRQITCEFVNIAKWKSAVCGLFFAKRCPKGRTCNFLHVFRNPGNEFWEADRDFETSSRHNRLDNTPVWHAHSERRSSHRRRTSRSRSRESSRSYSDRRRSTRDRSWSRSPVRRSHSRRWSRDRSSSSPDIPLRRHDSDTPPSPPAQREAARSTSRETSSYCSSNGRSKISKRKRSRRSRSRSASRGISKQRDCASASVSSTSFVVEKRIRSQSPCLQGKGSDDSKKHKKHSKERDYASASASVIGKHNHSQSPSREGKGVDDSKKHKKRSKERDCASASLSSSVMEKRSHSLSPSREGKGADEAKKHKKHKHKKCKKSSNKSKKNVKVVLQGPLSLPPLDDESEDEDPMEQTRDSDIKARQVTEHSGSHETQAHKTELLHNGVCGT